MFQQLNPFTTKQRHTKYDLVEVEGEYGGEQRLRGGSVENIPGNEKPAPPKTAEERIAELEAISRTLETRIAAFEARVPA